MESDSTPGPLRGTYNTDAERRTAPWGAFSLERLLLACTSHGLALRLEHRERPGKKRGWHCVLVAQGRQTSAGVEDDPYDSPREAVYTAFDRWLGATGAGGLPGLRDSKPRTLPPL